MKTKSLQKLILAILLSFCASNAFASLSGRVDSIINQPNLKKVNFAVQIQRADSGATLYSHNAGQPMIPASNMKIIASAAALKYLGPDFEYVTTIGLQDGALVVIGSGDPLLGDTETDKKYNRQPNWIMDEIVSALKQRGVTQIKDIIIDTTIFDDTLVHPSWPVDQLNRWYAAQVSGLNYNCNCIDITAKSFNGRVLFSLYPDTSYVSITNNATPASKAPDTLWFSRQLGTNNLTAYGKCYKRTSPINVTVHRPAAFFGFVLAENLSKAGIKNDGKLSGGPTPSSVSSVSSVADV